MVTKSLTPEELDLEFLAEFDPNEAKARLDQAIGQLRSARKARETCEEIVRRVPGANHYRYDLKRAVRDERAAQLVLEQEVAKAHDLIKDGRALIDGVARDDDEAWVRTWLRHGATRLAKVERLARGMQRVAGGAA